MKIQLVSIVLLLTLGGTTLAQTPPKKTLQQGAGTAASLPGTQATFPMRLALVGMTEANQAGIVKSLEELTVEAHACAHCAVLQAAAGACPKCQAPLKAERLPLFAGTRPSLSDGTVLLTLRSDLPTHLAAIEKALAAHSVTLDGAHLALPGPASLVVRGARPEQAMELQKALADAKLFAEVRATWNEKAGDLRIAVRPGTQPPTHAAIVKELAAHGLELGDVILGTSLPLD